MQKDERIDMSLIQQGGCSLESSGPAGEWTWAFLWSWEFQRTSIFSAKTPRYIRPHYSQCEVARDLKSILVKKIHQYFMILYCPAHSNVA